MIKKHAIKSQRAARSAAKTSRRAAPKTPASRRPTRQKPWRLRLYVAGQTPKSLTAFANLRRLCEQHITDPYEIEVIDLLKNPVLADGDQIVAIPTLIRRLPPPLKRIIGDLSNESRFLIGLDIKP